MSNHNLFIAVAVLATACATTAQPNRLDQSYGKFIRVCEQIYFPNSMALAPGVDPNEHVLELEKERGPIIEEFRGTKGVRYIESRLHSSTDALDRLCLKYALAELRGQPHTPGEQ